MATIKINYGGTTYSMIKTSSKITTPSVKIDGGWIPCFKGDRFAEVTHGNQIYTLSPLMVNGYRMACGIRSAYATDAYVTASCNYILSNPMSQLLARVEIDWSFSNSSGASVTVSDTNMYNSVYSDHNFGFSSGLLNESLPHTWSQTFTGKVTVKAGDTVLKQQNFSFKLSLSATSWGSHPSTKKIKIA